MGEANKKLFSKIVLIFFLLMIVVGFSVPTFLFGNNGNTPPPGTEPRLCQSDADCYLLCDVKPVSILCTQNLCHQNTCDQFSYYEFKEQPTTFSLEVLVNTEKINLGRREPPRTLFIKVNNDTIQMFSSQMTLNQVLEKLVLSLDNQCLSVGSLSYCTTADHFLSLSINSNESFAFDRYVPQENDRIILSYLPRNPIS